MDIIVIIVGLLPFLIVLTIWFAKNKMYKWHRFLQTVLFLVTIIALIYFKYGMYTAGGFEFYMKGSSIDLTMAFYFLVFHVIIASITLILWFITMKFASADKKRRALPGLYSRDHKKSGKRLAFAISLTSITGIGVYYILFIA
jgi:uncharacterized membrane protein YozB (DUF420 family)